LLGNHPDGAHRENDGDDKDENCEGGHVRSLVVKGWSGVSVCV
jgi:hypothetical protein